jgi:uncharacterized protein YaeQ
MWWNASADRLSRAKNLIVWRVPTSASEALGKLAARTMQLQCTIQEGQLWFSNAEEALQMELAALTGS